LLLTLKGRIGIGVGIFIGIILTCYGEFYLPRAKLVERTKDEIIRENLRLKQLKKKIEEYEKVKEECEQIKRDLSYYTRGYLSSEEEVYILLRDLGFSARTYGVNYIKIWAEKKIPGSHYDRIPVRIHLYSTYHALGRLLSEISGGDKAASFSMENIQIKETKAEKEHLSGEGSSYTVEADLVLYMYTYKQTVSGGEVSTEKEKAKKSVGYSDVTQRRRR
jgi:Tfp pilus assembly protein PilO